jgi:regulator of protease activity HflC (stomatin/prohibitin superfamily)
MEYIGYGFLVLAALVLIGMSVRIVPEFRRLIVFRMGRSLSGKGPGLIFLIPIVDRAVVVDLREVYFDVPPQTCITADNAHVSIDFLVYDKVVDPDRSVLAVEDFTGAARGLAITTLRAVVGAMDLDDVLSKRDEINKIIHEKLDDVTARWGIQITAVEIREVVPPAPIAEAMTRQMAAERNRRAAVADAEGQRQAAIEVAEGQKRAVILAAEGEREAALLRAQGFAQALKEIHNIAQGLDSKTLTLQYLEALKTLAAGDSTKFVIPTEFMNLAQPLVEHVRRSHQDSTGA